MGPHPREAVAPLLAESLRVMRIEVAACHERTRQALGGMVIRCQVDQELFTVLVDTTSNDILVGDSRRPISVRVVTSRETILALLHSRLALIDAVLSNALAVRGPVMLLERLAQAMTAYLHGAVRSQSFPSLLSRFEGPRRANS